MGGKADAVEGEVARTGQGVWQGRRLGCQARTAWRKTAGVRDGRFRGQPATRDEG